MSARRAFAAWPVWPLALPIVYGLLLTGQLLDTPRWPQNPVYFDFADKRVLLGIPYFGDVVSNLALLAAGAWGLAVVCGRRSVATTAASAASAGTVHTVHTAYTVPTQRAVQLTFFGSVVLTAFGSTVFHWSPGIPTLFWDRLPLGVLTAAVPALLIAERARIERSGRWALAAWLAAAALGVVYWRVSEGLGLGDLRPYMLLKVVAVAGAIVVFVALPARHSHGWGYPLALLLYGAATVTEARDAELYAALGWISGHTIKHLLSAGAVAAIAWMLARRRALAGDASR